MRKSILYATTHIHVNIDLHKDIEVLDIVNVKDRDIYKDKEAET